MQNSASSLTIPQALQNKKKGNKQLTCTLDSSSVIREIISIKAFVASEKLVFEVHRSLIILIARLRTLTPVSFMRSQTFSKYYQETNNIVNIANRKFHENKIKFIVYYLPLSPPLDEMQYTYQQAQEQPREQKLQSHKTFLQRQFELFHHTKLLDQLQQSSSPVQEKEKLLR